MLLFREVRLEIFGQPLLGCGRIAHGNGTLRVEEKVVGQRFDTLLQEPVVLLVEVEHRPVEQLAVLLDKRLVAGLLRVHAEAYKLDSSLVFCL